MRKSILFLLFLFIFTLSSCNNGQKKETIVIKNDINELYEYNLSIGDVVEIPIYAYDIQSNYLKNVAELSKNGFSLIALNDNSAIDINVENQYSVSIKCIEKYEETIVIDNFILSIENYNYVFPTNVKLNYVEQQPISLQDSLKAYNYDSFSNCATVEYTINPSLLNYTNNDKLEIMSISSSLAGVSISNCIGVAKQNVNFVELDEYSKMDFPYSLQFSNNFIYIELSTDEFDECGFDLCFVMKINGDICNVYSHLYK